MLTALAIAQNDIACYAKNRMAIFWTFVGPAVCMWFFGFLTPPGSGLTPVAVVHKDNRSPLSVSLITALRHHGHFVSETTEPTPGSLTVEVVDTPSPHVVLHAGERETSAERSLRYELTAELAKLTPETNSAAQPVSISYSAPPQSTGGFQRSVPAYLIMFLTMNLLMSGAGFAEERASGRIRRLLISPASTLTIVAGRLSSRLVVAWLQMLVLFCIGVFVLRIHWAENVVSLIALLSLYVLAMGSVGILIGASFKEPAQAMAFAMWSTLILAPLTGLWWPIELMPKALQTLGRLLPTGWVMQGVNAILAYGADLRQFPLAVAGLLTVAVAAIWATTRRLRST